MTGPGFHLAELRATESGRAPMSVREAAQLACLLEVSAPKPGNVSPGRHFADLRYEDFLASAIAIGEPLAGAGARGVGATIRLAVETTARMSRGNTNLGIVLLFAPLAKAAGSDPLSRPDSRGLTLVLESTTVEDARDAYAAMRLARPGGLDSSESQDVTSEPTMTVLDVMRVAAHRDTIAREYATGYAVTFDTAVPALERARRDGLPWDDAVVETFLTVLAAVPDTHITRRSGAALAAHATELARGVNALGGVRTDAGRKALEKMDRALRDAQHGGNPGTTADLAAAAIFVVLLGGGFHAVAR
jgi:triphosphoribosyl-dephospho-CoA synthase